MWIATEVKGPIQGLHERMHKLKVCSSSGNFPKSPVVTDNRSVIIFPSHCLKSPSIRQSNCIHARQQKYVSHEALVADWLRCKQEVTNFNQHLSFYWQILSLDKWGEKDSQRSKVMPPKAWMVRIRFDMFIFERTSASSNKVESLGMVCVKRKQITSFTRNQGMALLLPCGKRWLQYLCWL